MSQASLVPPQPTKPDGAALHPGYRSSFSGALRVTKCLAEQLLDKLTPDAYGQTLPGVLRGLALTHSWHAQHPQEKQYSDEAGACRSQRAGS